MERHFHEELQNAKKSLLEMAALVEESLTKSLEGFKKKDLKMASRVREIDHQIDKYEIDIEDVCIELIARHQPVSSDLRLLIGVIKMTNDLERMGDHAVNITDCIKFLNKKPHVRPPANIWSMAKIVKEMLKDSVDSFVDNDVVKAQSVCERDSVVDEMRDETIRIQITHMLEKPDKIGSTLQYISVAKNLERIADLSTNICEDVIFIAQARVIKHHAEEQKE